MGRVIRFQVRDKGVRQALQQVAAGDPKPAFAAVGRAVLSKVQLGFRTSADPWGSPWLPLKVRKGQPLVDTGALRRSIYAAPDSKGVTIGTKRLATWKGKTSDVARVHQFGATVLPRPDNKRGLLRYPVGGSAAGASPSGYRFARKSVIPARPFFPIRKGSSTLALPPAWSKAVVDSLRAFFAGKLKGKKAA